MTMPDPVRLALRNPCRSNTCRHQAYIAETDQWPIFVDDVVRGWGPGITRIYERLCCHRAIAVLSWDELLVLDYRSRWCWTGGVLGVVGQVLAIPCGTILVHSHCLIYLRTLLVPVFPGCTITNSRFNPFTVVQSLIQQSYLFPRLWTAQRVKTSR
jgi:hypothetical protein